MWKNPWKFTIDGFPKESMAFTDLHLQLICSVPGPQQGAHEGLHSSSVVTNIFEESQRYGLPSGKLT